MSETNFFHRMLKSPMEWNGIWRTDLLYKPKKIERAILIMETPNTGAGQLTEKIMLRVRNKLPALTTREYNRIYEAVLDSVVAECRDIPVRLHPDLAVPAILNSLHNGKINDE